MVCKREIKRAALKPKSAAQSFHQRRSCRWIDHTAILPDCQVFFCRGGGTPEADRFFSLAPLRCFGISSMSYQEATGRTPLVFVTLYQFGNGVERPAVFASHAPNLRHTKGGIVRSAPPLMVGHAAQASRTTIKKPHFPPNPPKTSFSDQNYLINWRFQRKKSIFYSQISNYKFITKHITNVLTLITSI